MQVHREVVVLNIVVTLMLSQWCSLSEAQLNPVEAAALTELCDRPGNDLWVNCSDSTNACINNDFWQGIECDPSNTSIVVMYVCSVLLTLHHHSLPFAVHRDRCCLTGVGGSIPASVGNLTQLEMLCAFFVNRVYSLFDPISLLFLEYFWSSRVVYSHSFILALSGPSTRISSLVPYHRSSANSLSSTICTLDCPCHILSSLMKYHQVMYLFFAVCSHSFIVALSETSTIISSMALSRLSLAR